MNWSSCVLLVNHFYSKIVSADLINIIHDVGINVLQEKWRHQNHKWYRNITHLGLWYEVVFIHPLSTAALWCVQFQENANWQLTPDAASPGFFILFLLADACICLVFLKVTCVISYWFTLFFFSSLSQKDLVLEYCTGYITVTFH